MDKIGFGFANGVVLILYLLAMTAIGALFAKKAGKNTDAFFKASGSVPSWAVGFSIYATTLSAITFMATPEKAFNGDWAYAAGNLSIIVIIPILIYFYVPFFRKLNVTTAYEYLEARFNPIMRVFGSVLFSLFHIGRIAIVIYLPTVAITSVSTINPYLVCAAIGVLCVIYSFLGGMEGVIWTDFIQGVILIGGALLVIAVGVFNVGGFGQVAADAVSNKKIISSETMKWSFTAATVPIIFIGSIFNSLQQYTSSQDVVQRYNTTKNQKETNKSLWTNGFLAFITIPIFYGMGTVLYSFYKGTNAAGVLPNFMNADVVGAAANTTALVPYFILTALPAGVAGIVIAAILAAAQSTISSSLNSISACVVVDIKQRFFGKSLKEEDDVKLARLIIIISGILGTIAALFFIKTNQKETWDLFLTFIGLFGVPIAGIFGLGIFTKRANGTGALIGLFASAFSCYWIQGHTAWAANPFVFSTFSFISAVVFGYIFSLIFNKDKKNITGLTIYTKDDEYVQ
ncbi:MAG: sodium:solute symporter [Peptostreptococcus sp.]|uniref:sodium:solute symporter n=1 Tax=Peptostreptococcus sp. TaxID=1262 RepID=UPI002FC7E45F